MNRLCNSLEPRVMNDDMLKLAVGEQGPQEEAGQLAKQEGILFKDVVSLQLDFQNILRIDNLWQFENLRKLQLDNNIIERIEGLENLTQLVWLDLSFNNIEAIEGLDTLVNLEDLSLFNNRISKIDSLDALVKLQVLSLGNNQIGNMMNIIYLRRFKDLRALSLSGNPIAEAEDYKMFVWAYLPDLVYLDSRRIDDHMLCWFWGLFGGQGGLGGQCETPPGLALRYLLGATKGSTVCGRLCWAWGSQGKLSQVGRHTQKLSQVGWLTQELSQVGRHTQELSQVGRLTQELSQELSQVSWLTQELSQVGWLTQELSQVGRLTQELSQVGRLTQELSQVGRLTQELSQKGQAEMKHQFSIDELRHRERLIQAQQAGGAGPAGGAGRSTSLTYKDKFVIICLNIFAYGLKQQEKRKVPFLPTKPHCRRHYVHLAVTPNAGSRLQSLNAIRDEADLASMEARIVAYSEDITELSNVLMTLEMQLVEQLEETINMFERNIVDMVGLFVENVQSLMAQCRDLENHHHEKLLEIAINTLEKVVKGELDEDLPEDVRALFVDKDTIVNAVGTSHDIHLLKIDNREDELVTRVNSWCTHLVGKIHKDEIMRNRKRVKEINQYIDHMQNELDNLDSGDILD
ncbi:dynein regulatory complex subunit 3 [Myotis lucifugus]|nr:dynein regulatory complex subunit 3 [Myotis lucifugus]